MHTPNRLALAALGILVVLAAAPTKGGDRNSPVSPPPPALTRCSPRV